jgi:hypothetical protein
MPCVTTEFSVDCADPCGLPTLCAAPLPLGIHARCVRHIVLGGTGPGRQLRAEIRVRRGIPATLVAARLQARFGACDTTWSLDGILVMAGGGPLWQQQPAAA